MPEEGRQNALPCLEEGGEKKKRLKFFIKLSSLLSWNSYSTLVSPATAGAAVSEEQGCRARRRRR